MVARQCASYRWLTRCYLLPVSCVDNLVDRSIWDGLDLFFFLLLLSIVTACVYLNLSRRKCRVEALSDHYGCWTGYKLWCKCDVTQLFYTTSRSITLVIDNQVLSCAVFLLLWLLNFHINKLNWWLQLEYSQCFNTKAKVKLLRTLCINLSTARFCATWTKDVWQHY